ncbi:MAG TPA: type II secretion system protein GspE, partial [Candidatus Eisenbacteria bacterium]
FPWFEGTGCLDCNNTGYRGRQGVYEVMNITSALRELILDRASATVMKRLAMTEGMRTLRMDGIAKLRRGLTSAEEVLKETAADNI